MIRKAIARITSDVDVDWQSISPPWRPFVLYGIWRFKRSCRRNYMHMRPGRRCFQATCVRCAWKTISGGLRSERLLWINKSRAQRATSSWWPTETRTLGSGRTYRVAIRPYEYEDYQAWLATIVRGV